MASPIRIIEFAFVAYPATNLERSRAFYEGILGLTSASEMVEGDQFWVEYEIGPHTLGIGNEPFLKPCGEGPQVVLELENFEESIAHLRACRIPFALEPMDLPPGCKAAIIFDPDGNQIGLHRRKLSPSTIG